MFFVAKLDIESPAIAPETFWFVSLDNEKWLGVSCDPRTANRDEVAAMLEEYEARNRARAFEPMRIDRSFLEARGAEFSQAA